jgi:hypothetical protein
MSQVHVTSNLRIRRSFGKIKKIIEIPNLIEIQKRSYDDFLQVGVSTEDRADLGLQAVFKSVFPIKDFNETASLEFVSYELGTPKYDVDECHQRGMTFAAPIKVKIQLVIWDLEGGHRSIKNVKEQEVYFGEIPLMTPNGTFMINGTEPMTPYEAMIGTVTAADSNDVNRGPYVSESRPACLATMSMGSAKPVSDSVIAIVADPANTLVESNESDNTWSGQWVWLPWRPGSCDFWDSCSLC